MPEFLERLMKQMVHRLIKVSSLRLAVLFLIVAVVVSVMIVMTIDFLWDGQFNAELEFAGVVTPFLDGLFLVVFVIAMFDEIREELARRKLAEEEIRKYLDNVQSFMVALDTEGRIDMINRVGCELLGYEESELLGRNWFETCLPHPAEADKVFSVFQRILAGEQPSDNAYMVICRDGHQRLISWHNTALLDDTGHIIGILSSGKDITEIEQAEMRLRESEVKFKALFDNATDGISIVDTEDKKLLLGNATLCQMLGYTPEEISKLHVMDIHPKNDLPYVISEFERAAKEGKSVLENIPVMRKDGSAFYAEITTAFFKTAGRTYLAGFFRDISERKLAESNLVEQLEELRRWHNSTLGREMRILELKHEVNELLGADGQPPRYPSAET